MVIFVEATHDVVVLRITNSDLTQNDHRLFLTAIEPFLATHHRVVLDMQDVRMLDGFGIGTLMDCLNFLRNKGGDLRFVNVAPRLRTFFEIARVSRMFQFFDSLETALASFETESSTGPLSFPAGQSESVPHAPNPAD
jgi:anti-anti-sigma factor